MGVKAGCRRPESAKTVRGFAKRRNWEDLYIGDALRIFRWTSCSGHIWDVLLMPMWRICWKTVGGICRAPRIENCL